jgi:hypothetical protein
MPQSAWSTKREPQYEHINESLEHRGTNEDKADQIAARSTRSRPATANPVRRAARPSTK